MSGKGKKGRRGDDYWESEAAEADAALVGGNTAPKAEAAPAPAAESPQAGGKKKNQPKSNDAAKPAAEAKAPTSESAKTDLEVAPADPKPTTTGAVAEPAPAATGAEDGDDGEDDEEDTKEKPSAAKAKDGAKKKKKPEAKKAAAKGAAARAALAKRIQEEQAVRKAEEEEMKRLEEEAKKREEEERKLDEQREKKAAEDREKAKIAKKERAAIALKEAEKKAAEQRKRDALSKYSGTVAAAAQVQASLDGTTAPAPAPDAADEAAPAPEAKVKRPIYEKKKSKKAGAHNNSNASSTATSAAPSPPSSGAPSVAVTPLSQSVDATASSAAAPAAAATISTPAVNEDEDWEAVLEKPVAPVATPDAKPAAQVGAAADGNKPAAVAPAPAQPQVSMKKAAEAKKAAAKAKEEAEAAEKKEEELRSPICCVLGHVDVGKTKLLDKIRRTNYQDSEAGGITQQIGATYFPVDTLKEKTRLLSEKWKLEIKVPGLLVIDTPGHESFTNLRARGSSLCDIAVLVVDLMHGLEPQTIQSIEMLKKRKCPFVVALNKVDRLYGWKANPNSPFQQTLKEQNKDVKAEFDQRVQETRNQFSAQGLNAILYYQNKDFKSWVSLIPTSAHSGEGIPDLLMLLVQLTQRMMKSQLVLSETLGCTVLEVKVVEGHGTTIDVILYDGALHEGDEIVVCGLNGPICTNIRALLTPPPLKEIRFKSQYVHHKVLCAAQGIKIAAPDLEHAVAGSQLYVVRRPEDKEAAMKEVMKDLENVTKLNNNKGGLGVYVQASTLGSLEALLEFLKDSDIPVSSVALGPVHKKDVIKASVMLERSPEHAVILAFDVKITDEAAREAEKAKVRIFSAEIIYHLFDQFTKYMNDLRNQKKKEAVEAVFPCMMQVIPEYIFHVKDPIIVGIRILDGSLRMGSPVCVPSKEFIELGRVTSLEVNHKPVEIAKKGDSVAVRLEGANPVREYGRHFDSTNLLYTKITLDSLDELNTHFKDELSKEDELLLKEMRKIFKSRLHIM